MKPEEIKQAIADKGYSVGLIADALGRNHATVSVVINGHSTSYRTASFIAKVIEKPLSEVFPHQPSYAHQPPKGAEREQKKQELQRLLAS